MPDAGRGTSSGVAPTEAGGREPGISRSNNDPASGGPLAGRRGTAYSFAMPILDTQRQRAAWLILALGLALLWALWPFGTGLIGALVLYVVFAPVQRELTRTLRPGPAAVVVVVLAIVLVVAPLASVIGLLATEAQDMATGVIRSPLLA